ncbi:MAG: pilin [Pseudomonadota bacterium]|jgi:prepilin-type N-terminal cleavage/methylation domain-containing protein
MKSIKSKQLTTNGSLSGVAGFTLVELMVVVAIIGILAAVAGPRVQAFRARGVQSEAKANLNSIYLAQSAYQDAQDKFFDAAGAKAVNCKDNVDADCGADFAFRQLSGAKYDYQVFGDSGSWSALAVSKQKILNNKTDIWRINASKVLCAPVDAVTKKEKPAGCVDNSGGTLTLDALDAAQ